jgi:rhodanese-related sulfurtransferase
VADLTVPEALVAVAAGAMLLDVREDHEWEAGHAPQAVHMPMSRLAERAGEVPRDRTIVCVCHVGARSAAVADALGRAGWDAVNLAGGMDAWVAAGQPLVNPAGGPGSL